MSTIVRHYDASKNPGTRSSPASIPGVPLSDIDQVTWDALPEHVRADVDASPMYRKTKPPERTRDTGSGEMLRAKDRVAESFKEFRAPEPEKEI